MYKTFVPDLIECLRNIKENTTCFFALVQGLIDFLREEEQVVTRTSTLAKTRVLAGNRLLLSKNEYNLVLISLSTNLPRQFVRLIGLNLSGSRHIPSFFGIMIIIAQILGIPDSMDLFMRQNKIFLVYSNGNFFNNRLWIWSAPGE